ncbi:MAG TPA: thymidine phosphorylase, partial [Reyranella sp.]|nr:thymidine phosphorylase [Reyranella sp.]
MVAALGGPDDFLEHSARYLAHASVIRPCHAERSGHVVGMDARQVGIAVVALGGGRSHADDAIDPSVGLTDVVDVGTPVRAGSLLGVVHAASDGDADQAIGILQRAIRIEDAAPAERPTIIDRIGR